MALCLASGACESPSEELRAGPPARLDIVSGDQQEAVVGAELADPLVIRVVDAAGTPVPGQLLNFRVTSGGGSVFAGSSVTNEQGLSQERWTLGPVAGDRSASKRARSTTDAGTNVRVTTIGSVFGLAANGDVVFTDDNQIIRFRDGALAQLTADDETAFWNISPRTDGLNVVYQKRTPCCGPLQSIIALHDGTNEVLLTTARADIMADLDYQVNDGWVAFTKPGGGGVLQLWTRGPDGVERQVWSVGAHSRIHALGPGGQVVFSSGTRRYLSAPPYTEAPDDIGNAWLELSPPSRVLWVDGELVVTLGRSAFRIH